MVYVWLCFLQEDLLVNDSFEMRHVALGDLLNSDLVLVSSNEIHLSHTGHLITRRWWQELIRKVLLLIAVRVILISISSHHAIIDVQVW